jgi:hypothetical protein
MNTTPALLFAVLLASTTFAQDDKKSGAPPMPEPKHPQHEALRSLAGTWDVVMRCEAMPGVPGKETASESKGIERAELVNNGLWLKSTVDATYQNKPFQGLWLAGYDPFQKQYVSVWVSSDETEPGACEMTGSYDEAKKTWTWRGKTPQGDMRSETVVKPDTIVETCYMVGADGKEQKVMELTRKRASGTAPVAVEASASKIPAELAVLHKDIGEWTATVRCSGPGQPATEEKGTEHVRAIAGGRWLWSDFHGTFGGKAFEGHSLTGYDPNDKKVVSIWIDSMSPVWTKTTGSATGNEITLTGTGTDPNGKPTQIKQVVKHADDSMRSLAMECNCAEGLCKMDIAYRRKQP